MKTSTPKITKKGLKARSKSPREQSPRERKQAIRTEQAIKETKRLEKEKAAAEKKRIQERLKKINGSLGSYTGIKRLAYRVKLFWLIPGSRPKRFYNVRQAIRMEDFDFLKAATIALAKQCFESREYGDEAVKVWLLLENPPPGSRKANIAASCRVFADMVLDGER
jgi:Zn-dependent metalloprotease